MEAILLALREELKLTWHPRGPAAYQEALAAGGLRDNHIYPAVMLPWTQLHLERCEHPYRVLYVQRDPRDLLVSRYYSMKYSHGPMPSVNQHRPLLLQKDEEQGMLQVMDSTFSGLVNLMLSHLDKGEENFCSAFEFGTITRDPFSCLNGFLRWCGWEIPEPRLRNLLDARSFAHLSGGRKPGHEDQRHHYRKGITGDWRNKFTPAIRKEFKKRFAKALIELGYERDEDW
jgi:hypothetical protein